MEKLETVSYGETAFPTLSITRLFALSITEFSNEAR